MKKIARAALLVIVPVFAACNDSTSANNNSSNPASGFNNVSGQVTLAIHASGSRSTPYGSENITKNENIAVNLSFVLPLHKLTTSGIGSNCAWDSPVYGGMVNWFEEMLTEYDCMGGRATDKDTVIKTYGTNASGEQPGGVLLTIQNDGSYQINVTAAYTGTPIHIFHSTATNCGTATYTSNNSDAPGTPPFAQYFAPFTNGAMGSLTGKTETKNPAHIAGVFNGTDNLTVIDKGTTPVVLPFDYTVTWDLTMIK